MEIPRDPTDAEIARFILTRSGGQMAQLVSGIREPVAQAAFTASLLIAPPAVAVAVASHNSTPEKAKKALNAFVGFRCYYISSPVFKPWPMKKLSNLMGIMWEGDPNKSHWSLMTKAWSTIRDQIGKDKAPLYQFFRIICPYLNMPAPETYLELHGWILTLDKEGGPTLSRDDTLEPASVSAGVADMALSVEDIIGYCQSMGYAQEYVADTNTTSPTFLGHTLNQAGQGTTLKVSTQTAESVHEGRVAARNKRRTKRQNARETGVVSGLQEQIVNAYVAGVDTPREDPALILNNEPNPFYGQLAGLLTHHLANDQDGAGLPSNVAPTSNMFNPTIPASTDWSAFRLGADANAILPSFDPSSL